MAPVIVTTWHDEQHPARLAEYREALRRNVDMGGQVVVLIEDGNPGDGVVPVLLGRRPTFSDAIAAVRPGTLVCIINGDCHLTGPLPITRTLWEGSEAWAISRREPDGTPHNDPKSSQDAWVFRIPADIEARCHLLGMAQFPFGMPGCDCTFARLLEQAGFQVINPCLDVVVVHRHAEDIRSYDKTDPSDWVSVVPYLYVEPCHLPVPDISVITPHGNRLEHLRQTLAHNAELCRGRSVEFVVCHLADQSGAAAWQREAYPWTVCVEAEGERFNYARACNVAHRHARGTVQITVDADNLLTPEYLDDVVAAFADGADAIVHEHDAKVSNNDCAGRIALRRETFARLGGYDERFQWWGGVDTELINRCVDRFRLVNRGRRKGHAGSIAHGDEIRQKSAEGIAHSREVFRSAKRAGRKAANPDHPWGMAEDRCIPGHGLWGFNAGVVRLADGWLVADRYQAEGGRWAVMLRRFDLVWNETRRETPAALIGAEDLRLVGPCPLSHAVVAFGTWAPPEAAIRQVVASIDPDALAVLDRQIIAADFPMQPAEKNWAPFCHGGRWFLSYGMRPHLALKLNAATGACRRRFVSLAPDLDWAWGEPRGGTPWLHLGDEGMLCCWHSMLTGEQMAERNPVRHEREQKDKYYFAAWALAEARPPFRILAVSKAPLHIEDGIRQVATARSAAVVFPMALMRGAGEDLVLAYGEHDERTRMVSIPWSRIKASLRPVSTARAPFGEVRCG